MTRRRSSLAGALTLALAVSGAAGEAEAQDDPFAKMGEGDDVIVLADGTALRGKVLERVIDDHVTIRTLEGRVVRVAWRDLRGPAPSASPLNPGPLFYAIGAIGVLGGGGTLLASAFVHDDPPRGGMQIGGGVALGAGVALIIIGFITDTSNPFGAFGAVH